MLLNQADTVKQLSKDGYKYSRPRINQFVKTGRLTINDGLIEYEDAIRLIKEIQTITPGQQLTRSRALKEKSLARLRQLEVLEKEGKLLDRKTVESALFKKARSVRDSLLNIPSRISPILSSIIDQSQIESLLRKEIIEALKELSSENGNSLDQKNGNGLL